MSPARMSARSTCGRGTRGSRGSPRSASSASAPGQPRGTPRSAARPSDRRQVLERRLGGEAGDETFLGGHLPGSLSMRLATKLRVSGADDVQVTNVRVSPARWVSRGRMSIRQQKCSAPSGAVLNEQVQRGCRSQHARAPAPRARWRTTGRPAGAASRRPARLARRWDRARR